MALAFAILGFFSLGCGSTGHKVKTVEKVDVQAFMGDWYVLAGRFTFLEVDVHNGIETYSWNATKERIDVGFSYNRGSFTGPKKSISQKAWVHNAETGAHWKISPLWPLKLDYLVVALDKDYRWTAVGVPDQKYLWIMARDWKNPDAIVEEAVNALKAAGYKADNLIRVPHQW